MDGRTKVVLRRNEGTHWKMRKKEINGARPFSRPAKFPMASAPLAVSILDFVGRVKRNFLRAQEAFARFSASKYFGRDNEEQLLRLPKGYVKRTQ